MRKSKIPPSVFLIEYQDDGQLLRHFDFKTQKANKLIVNLLAFFKKRE